MLQSHLDMELPCKSHARKKKNSKWSGTLLPWGSSRVYMAVTGFTWCYVEGLPSTPCMLPLEWRLCTVNESNHRVNNILWSPLILIEKTLYKNSCYYCVKVNFHTISQKILPFWWVFCLLKVCRLRQIFVLRERCSPAVADCRWHSSKICSRST